MIDANTYILHIETSTKVSSIAISKGSEIIGFLDLKEGMNHTALLAPAIDQLMKTNSLQNKQLAAISISSGPGSYTGLRVGSSTAKAMAYSLGIPILSVPTLLALANAAFEKYPDAQLVMPMLDARRNEVYTAIYNPDLLEYIPVSSLILEKKILSELITPEKLIVICGDGAAKVGNEIGGDRTRIDPTILTSAAHLVGPALRMYRKHQYSDAMHFVPFYLKPPNITQPRIVW